METRRRFSLGGLLAALILAGEIFFAADMAFTRADSHLPAAAAAALFLLSLGGGLLLALRRPRALRRLLVGFTLALALTAAALLALWYYLYSSGGYIDTAPDRASCFADKTVMVIVPHQDDELNIAGGILEQYTKHGSKVYVVYATNGDYNVDAGRRAEEAAAGMARCGIAKEQLIFLGYGDNMSADGRAFVICGEDEPLRSRHGHEKTYAGGGRQPFRSGRAYTRRNMYEDMRDVITAHMPDVIFCCDTEMHVDHRLVSQVFERAMGEILRTHSDYRPMVYKAFAYSTAYYAQQDFYSVNLASTVKPTGESYMADNSVYNWDERLRLPVAADGLSRSMLGSAGYKALREYDSQETVEMSDGIINADKVFWQRETVSLSYGASFTASSGRAAVLNDFMLTELPKGDKLQAPYANLCTPQSGDAEPEITVTLPERAALRRVVLYDNPSPEDNILDSLLTFDDGSSLHTGALEKNGSGTELEFEPKLTGTLSIRLLKAEGARAGLTEVELYDRERDCGFELIKLLDRDGSFVYDYIITDGDSERFGLYTLGCELELRDCLVSCEGDAGCSAELEDGALLVKCPRGRRCVVTVSSPDGRLSDSVLVRNTGTALLECAQRLERYMRKELIAGIMQSNTWCVLRDVYHLIRDIAA